MNYFVDSSVWIEYFKGNTEYLFLNELINTNAICTNDIVLTELLPAIIHKKEHELAELLGSIKKYELNIDWQDIRDIQQKNIQHGNSNTGISDIIIVQNCIQNKLRLISRDKHFKAMTRYTKLALY